MASWTLHRRLTPDCRGTDLYWQYAGRMQSWTVSLLLCFLWGRAWIMLDLFEGKILIGNCEVL